MAFRHGKVSYFAMGSSGSLATMVNISSYLTEVSMPRPVDTAETSTFGTTAKSFVIGLYTSSFSFRGRYDDTLDTQINALLGLEQAVGFMYAPGGLGTGTAGRKKITGIAYVSTYDISGSSGDMVGISLNGQCTGAIGGSTMGTATTFATTVATALTGGNIILTAAPTSVATAGVCLIANAGDSPSVVTYTGVTSATLNGCVVIAGPNPVGTGANAVASF